MTFPVMVTTALKVALGWAIIAAALIAGVVWLVRRTGLSEPPPDPARREIEALERIWEMSA